ncbi:conserved hypothetical protein [Formosa agariphila KMM 3901]|uniref:Lipoprotein n=1 Tax=Formosa agariphila (strain DSM 15362 / KCTC 12365 / LMG 23005 / KMM 3901 / M-2Alg 35-1) TaxID=1347342 RepID=T2KM54_FORAG|nr:hypothetical protein [Formosa agariphila]CDF79516.1 conserved hypothetical protein [Formosa agariphila KMM 3901]
MKKAIYITLIFGILISCSGDKTISEIQKYVNGIESRTDLNESVTEFNTENHNGEIAGGTLIYELTDKDNNLYRITKESSNLNDTILNYEFYYKNKKLIFAKVIKFSNNLSKFDTIVNSELYYKNGKLIEQINQKPNGMDSEYVKLLAESMAVEGLGTE